MSVVISNHYGSKLPLPETKIRYIAEKLLREVGFARHTLSILLTDDTEIRRLNHTYRNIDKATNVLSFPFADGLEEDLSALPIQELGDIVISLDTAAKEAEEYDQRLIYRIAWLTAHGLLHLLGYDHERSPKDAELMFEKEKDLLEKVFINRSRTMPQLAINVDHVATIRQARGGREPDPVFAASLCELAGASGIVVHLREDRRHIQDSDVYLLRKTIKTKLNLEMGANKEIIDIALDIVPDMITLVPEKRQELTTEGGLDVISQKKKLARVVQKFAEADIPVSIFIDPDSEQIRASYDIGAKYVEIHTGRYCDAINEEQMRQEFFFIADAAEEAHQLGLIVNAGHGLDYRNTALIAALDTIDELSIGHAIISRAVFTGLEQAVKDMQIIILNAQSLQL
ncbi:pyridoxine 5'-phosphate synthase [Desulfopila inferna]|uniref:pyridoxine 5'-phosphate synthase n=1 Tax=Desulfopila inferna TaxID=468528 RepID=UPI00196590F8|nr:pyridoxine 5'-phosphate synthase [Desulfopila inferna]MBM9603032.1 pyridoxine 5'-phosphate synthase [Desulfopila inferna]